MTTHPAVETRSPWRLSDRLGLAFAWFLGLLFCAICAGIVVYLLIQGLRYLSPGLLWTNPKVGNSQNETGGFLAPMLGTIYATAIAMALATPIGVGVAVWLSEYGRPRPLARVVESTVEMFAGAPSIASPDVVTFLEEEKIVAYFGAGYLYATPARSEPYL